MKDGKEMAPTRERVPTSIKALPQFGTYPSLQKLEIVKLLESTRCLI